MSWHTKRIEETLAGVGSSKTGLTDEAVRKAMETHGRNEFVQAKRKSTLSVFFSQFNDFMIIVLLVAAVISGFSGELVDSIVIIAIVLINAIIGFVQEYRAEKTMEALRGMATPKVPVLRNGTVRHVLSTEVVKGDIVNLEAGQIVPADMRLIEIYSLRIEEAVLTGESLPVDKMVEPLADENIFLGDRVNMAYKATKVIYGRGVGVVTDVGMDTEIGKIAGMLQQEDVKTPLQKRMAAFGKRLSFVIIGICVAMFVAGLLRGEKVLPMLMTSVTLAVAAIPEALPALITIALARGAKRLADSNVVVRKLPAVETLGSVTYICSDKTGTITRNEMLVTETKVSEEGEAHISGVPLLEVAMALSHNVAAKADGRLLGDPTETALVAYITERYGAKKWHELEASLPRVKEFPFDSERKRMATVHKHGGRYLVFVKGAIESIRDVQGDGANSEEALRMAEEMAAQGARVLAFAFRELDAVPSDVSEAEAELTFAGLVSMTDPPREDAVRAIAMAHKAGIVPVMITGDHLVTASAVATQVGILEEGVQAMTGADLAGLAEAEFSERVERIRVYARVSPEQKLDIVKALQQRGHIVAMTGDGANDAPSLKAADIGVAMGITGTDVSKEAAHIILLDDNFATIVTAVKEGRRIYDNIRRFVKYIMACNSAEILIIFSGPLLGMPVSLLPIHILWINLVTDGLPGLALAGEKAEPDIMSRKPRSPKESLFAAGVGLHIAWVGMFMAVLTLGIQKYMLVHSNGHWQTMVFTTLLLAQLGHVFAIRSDKHYIFKKGIFANPLLLVAILFTFLLQLAIIYLPFANQIFKTQPLSLYELGICITGALVMFHAVECEKFIRRILRK